MVGIIYKKKEKKCDKVCLTWRGEILGQINPSQTMHIKYPDNLSVNCANLVGFEAVLGASWLVYDTGRL